MRERGTSCEASTWISDSSMICRPTRGLGGTSRTTVTLGMFSATLSEALSYGGPVIYGNIFDGRQTLGHAGYNPEFLPGNACADGTAEVEFVPGGVYGCAGEWTASTGGLASAGTDVCGVGYATCASADEVASFGVNSTGCSVLPPSGTFWATGESATDGTNCSSDGTDGKVRSKSQ